MILREELQVDNRIKSGGRTYKVNCVLSQCIQASPLDSNKRSVLDYKDITPIKINQEELAALCEQLGAHSLFIIELFNVRKFDSLHQLQNLVYWTMGIKIDIMPLFRLNLG